MWQVMPLLIQKNQVLFQPFLFALDFTELVLFLEDLTLPLAG